MATRPMNLVFITSDEHNKQMMGCSGHPVVKTPNLDHLAAKGVRFADAYCNNPICVPSRASMATGRYVHKIENWDNAMPYVGKHPSWGHRLISQGHEVTTIGKLHFRNAQDDTGFPDQRIPLHVLNGIGDLYSLMRDNQAPRPASRHKITDAGPGESSYIRYDRGIAAETKRFLKQKSQEPGERPWALFVSLVTPHFPLIAPQEFYDLYPLDQVVFPKQYSLDERPTHPVLEEFRRVWDLEDELDEMTVRKAVAAYYGLCSFLDAQVGEVLRAIEEYGLSENTRIIYTSDHGDTVGDHGLWFKHTMYDGSAGVPLIMAGPDLPKGKVTTEPASWVDMFPTVVEAVGANLIEEDRELDGTSLFPLATGERSPNRVIFSEYHAAGAMTAFYMVRKNNFKFVYYVGYAPQLFDLEADPDEIQDLAGDPNYAEVLADCERELRAICDPEAVDLRARAAQSAKVEEHGGREAVLKAGYNIPFSPTPKQFQ